jgi:hypothetical protein
MAEACETLQNEELKDKTACFEQFDGESTSNVDYFYQGQGEEQPFPLKKGKKTPRERRKEKKMSEKGQEKIRKRKEKLKERKNRKKEEGIVKEKASRKKPKDWPKTLDFEGASYQESYYMEHDDNDKNYESFMRARQARH